MTRGVAFAIVLAVLGPCLEGSRTASAAEAALLAYGRHLASECTACHTAEAGAGSGGIPAIAGRPAPELIELLHAFQEGRRTNPVMVSVARSLDERQIAALAAYFASLPKPAAAPSPAR